MKQLLFTFILLFVSWSSFSQEEFSFTLYFEDAAGNRDSLILGYDELATDSVDEEFGEENILNEPWANDLDVRIGDKTYTGLSGIFSWLTENTYLSKKQILETYCEESLHSSRVSIQYHTSNFPITVTWDKNIIANDSCSRYSFFFGKQDHYHLDVAGYYPLRYLDSLQIDSTFQDELATYSSNGKSIGVLQFVFRKESTLNSKENIKTKLSVYPNPVQSNELLTIEFSGNYSIINNLGQMVQNGKVENHQINVHDVPKGRYFLILENGNQLHKLKIVKL